jgi:hypothetical protein
LLPAPEALPGGAAQAGGQALLVWVLGAVAVAVAGWALAGRLLPGTALAAGSALALTAWSWQARALPRRAAGWALGLWGGCGALGLLLAALTHDLSFDGQQYHQQAIQVLAGGWNPFHDAPYRGMHAQWINGYAKGAWTWGALFPALGLSVELGKSINLLFASAAFLCCFDTLHRTLRLSAGRAAMVAATAAASPVWAAQWNTFTNDGLIACLMLVFAARAISLAMTPGQRGKDLLTLCLVLMFLPLIKGSGAAYAALLWLALAAGLLCFAAWSLALQALAWGGLALAAGVLLLGFNPYVTNSLRHGHPLHPLAGPGRVDIITPNAPAGILEHNRWVKLLGSAVSRSHSTISPAQPAAAPPALQLKWPGTVSGDELRVFATKTDVRVGGFGPLFGLALALGLAAGAACLVTRQTMRRKAAALFVAATVLAISLAFPEPWWARYVPQFWLLPLALAVALWLTDPASRLATRLAWTVVLVSALDALLVAALYGAGSTLRELDHRAQLHSLRAIAQRGGPLAVDLAHSPALGHRLDRQGIAWRAVPAGEGCATGWLPLEYTELRVCLGLQDRQAFVPESPLVSRLKQLLGKG